MSTPTTNTVSLYFEGGAAPAVFTVPAAAGPEIIQAAERVWGADALGLGIANVIVNLANVAIIQVTSP